MRRELSRRIMALSVRSKVALVWRLFRDPGVPAGAKALLPVIVGYTVLPFDVVPDFVPVLGQLDDLLIIALGLGLFLLLTPTGIIEDHLLDLE